MNDNPLLKLACIHTSRKDELEMISNLHRFSNN